MYMHEYYTSIVVQTNTGIRIIKAYRAVWADKATHVLHNAKHWCTCLPAKGQLPPHIRQSYSLCMNQAFLIFLIQFFPLHLRGCDHYCSV